MPNSVNDAFSSFLRDSVNLDADRTAVARSSRDNLVSNIRDLADGDNFFKLWNDADIFFGSFARKTKIRPLDDIDYMCCLWGDDSTYLEYADHVEITVNKESSFQRYFCNSGTNILNSTKVINAFVKRLEGLHDYRKAELHKRGEAATVQLQSYEWNFDIVPCFLSAERSDGRTVYFMPDGNGNWKMTDPRVDRDNVQRVNQKVSGRMLDTIRLTKYWNQRPTMPSVKSYLLECLIVNYFDALSAEPNAFVDNRFTLLLGYLKTAIYSLVQDPKGIQGNLNDLSYTEMMKISERANRDYQIAYEANNLEVNLGDHVSAGRKWREIFGPDFPVIT